MAAESVRTPEQDQTLINEMMDAAFADLRSYLESSNEFLEVHRSDTHTWLIIPKDLADEVLQAVNYRHKSEVNCEYCGRSVYAAGGKDVACDECRNFRFLNHSHATDRDGNPTSLDSLAYADYLRSSHWKDIRDEKVRHAKGACACCGSTLQLHVHHRQYPKSRLDIEPDMLVVLCKRCHECIHDGGR